MPKRANKAKPSNRVTREFDRGVVTGRESALREVIADLQRENFLLRTEGLKLRQIIVALHEKSLEGK